MEVDTWILYATRHRVKELYLDFFSGIWSDWKTHCLYDLPHFILSSESLEVLTLKCCRLIRPSSMCFGSLKSLNLQQMMLHDGMIENVISYCPLLENLGIKDCNTEIDLSIKTDRGIKSLMIEDISLVPSSNAVLLIHAPKLLYLEFKGNYPRAEYRISNLQSLVAVSIHFGDILCKDNDKLEVGHCDTVKKLLDDLCHVKHVKLCCQCLQVLAFRKLRCLDNPLCNITCLELKTGLRKLKLPGIAYLLKSCCPNLDIFVLRIDEKLPIQSKYADWLDDQGVHIDEGECWNELALSCAQLLPRLKIVSVYGFHGYRELSSADESENWRKLFFTCKRELDFLKIMLPDSRMKKKMTVNTIGFPERMRRLHRMSIDYRQDD